MIVEVLQIFCRDFVDISYDRSNHWIDANWKGYQSDASVKEGCELLLEAMTTYQVAKVLNDNRQVQGIWTGVADWLARDWFPRMRTAGMKKFALIYSPSRFSQLSADAAMLLFDPDGQDVAGFYSENTALTWLATNDYAVMLRPKTEDESQ